MKESTEISTHIVRFLFLALVAGFAAVILYGFQALSIPIGISLLLAFALSPAVDFVEALGVSRVIAVSVVLILAGLITYMIFSFLIPPAVDQARTFYSQLEVLGEKIPVMINQWKSDYGQFIPEDYLNRELNLEWLSGLVLKPVKDISVNIISVLPDVVTYLLITPILLFIFLLQGSEIFKNVIALVPNRYFELALLIVHRIRNQLSNYLKGIGIQVLILGVILMTGYSISGLPYGVVLGAFGALVNIIPYVGPVIGLIPAITIGLIAGGPVPLFVLLVFGIAQLVDNAFTQPVVLARSVSVHPVIAILALITFQNLLGVVGMIIAIPAAGILVMTIETLYKSLKAFRVI